MEFHHGQQYDPPEHDLGLAGFLAFFGREVFDWCRDTVTGYKRRRDWENRNRR